jgi:hypothetical protein
MRQAPDACHANREVRVVRVGQLDPARLNEIEEVVAVDELSPLLDDLDLIELVVTKQRPIKAPCGVTTRSSTPPSLRRRSSS